MKSWLEFWNAPNTLYVNQRHREAHYEVLRSGISRHLPAGADVVVLDWGCGDALAAEQIARLCGTVLLFDAAENTREALRGRYAGHARIRVLDEAALAALAPDSVDLVIVNSVIQYLTRQQFVEAVLLFHRLLRTDGAFLLGDVIGAELSLPSQVSTFLSFAFRHGFLIAASVALLKTATSPYRKLRRAAGYACYSEAEVTDLLRSCGFSVERLASNIAVNQHRRSYICRKAGAAPA